MTKGKSIAIVKQIKSDKYDPEEKLYAIQDMLYMETHNSITKMDLLNCLEWLVDEYI